ncbi:cytoplasmic membrane protein [Ostreococcus tauri]|uniref:Cytoplasmic membrane protein n=1 Tax=Ostreococcus tauri TaxID=70448 RepID=A0A1Y5I7P7_OSTTA|nr:cytoplasmic membrane protein [Ostreococcus tauri]
MIGSSASEAASRAVEDATDGERDASTSTSESKRASRSGMGWIGLDVDKALSTFAKGGNKGATGVGKPTLPTFERREEKTRGIKAAKPKVKDAEKLKLEWGDTLSWDSTRVDGTALNGERAPSPDVFDAILGVIDVEEMENLERQQRAKRIARQLERRRRKREQDEEKRKRKALEQARAQARRKGDVFRSIDFEDEQETIDSKDESKPFIAVVKETVDSLMQSDVAKWTFNFIVIPSLISRIVAFTVIAPIVGEELKLQGQDRTTIELREDQESEILAKLDRFKQRMDYEVVMGRQAPLPAVEVERRIRAEAQRLEDEAISQYVSVDGNRYADLVFFAAFLIMIVAYNDQARLVVTGTKNAFFGLEPAQQAFLLLLSSDVLVGYHSADAWQTLLRAIGGHYGFAEDENLISLFVAFVPVSVDVAFKFWVFKYLRRLAPSTQVILDDIDRH